MKMPTAGGVITILGNQEEARRCEDNAACAMKNMHAIEAANNEEEEEGLRNAGCTFNRTITTVLDTQLDRNISTYVDVVVVRSKKREDHISDL